MTEFEDHDDYEREEWPRDEKIDEAVRVIRAFFEERRKEVFYTRQLQVLFEGRFFHWITAKALLELRGSVLRTETVELQRLARVKFVFHPRNRYVTRRIGQMMKVIRKYSNPIAARAAGRHAEVMFFHALARSLSENSL